MELDTATQTRINTWINGEYDPATKADITYLQTQDPQTLRDSFYTELAFGTGGLRGIMGPGTNRVNIYTIRRATLGLARYIQQQQNKKPARVVIGFDSRHHSRLFAEETAKVLAAEGIEVFLFKELRPTPLISFACRHLGCTAGVMITASHNPKEYNGYKVYWADGAQVVAPHDTGIMQQVLCIERYDQIATTSLDHPLIHLIDTEMDEAYVKAIRPLQQSPKQNSLEGKSLKIIYSSLHGAGIALVPMALQDWGFNQIVLVTEQCTIDGSFPTVKSPNPENPDTLKLGIEQLEKSRGDLLFITDPDADRLGVVVMDKGCPILLNGNETASICTWYLAHKHKELHTLSDKHAVVTTIVSTQLMPAIAHAFGIQCMQVLTGFKYIGEKIHEWEESPNGLTFLFGAEESYGYLVGTHSRDKDAVVACCLLAEIALYAKKNNQTLIDLLHQIYAEYGIFRELQHSIDFPAGKNGMDQIRRVMDRLRSSPIHSLMGNQTLIIEDYLTGDKTQVIGGRQEKLHLPTSDVLVYQFKDASRIIIRPSGTEPKIKIYVGVRYPPLVNIEEGIIQADTKLKSLLKAIKETILSNEQGSV